MKKWLKKIVLNWFKDEIDQLISEKIEFHGLIDRWDLEIEIQQHLDEIR